MRYEHEEQAIRMAFGEAELEPGLLERDGDLKDLAEQYRAMRSDMALLRDIPECQLSVERLRDAILRAGIRQSQEPRRVWFATALAVACTLLVGFGLLRQWNSGTVRDDEHLRLAAAPNETETTVATVEPPNPSSAAEAVGDRPLAERSPVAQRTGVRKHRAVRFAVAPKTPKTLVEPSVATSDRRSAATTVPDSVDGSEPVVLIMPEQDDATGAQRASEMESADHVVIGG
jgi:hypothetical protein